MCQIQYEIRVQLFEKKPTGSLQTILEKGMKVRVVPSTKEEPPLNITDNNAEFYMRKEKSVKKGVLRKNLSRIVIAAAQPKALRLTAPQSSLTSDKDTTPTAMATLNICFDPVDENQ